MDDSTCTWETLVALRKEVEALGPFPLRLWFIGIPYGTQVNIEARLRDAGITLYAMPKGLGSTALQVITFDPLREECPLGNDAPWFARYGFPGVWVEMSDGNHQRIVLDENAPEERMWAAFAKYQKEKEQDGRIEDR